MNMPLVFNGLPFIDTNVVIKKSLLVTFGCMAMMSHVHAAQSALQSRLTMTTQAAPNTDDHQIDAALVKANSVNIKNVNSTTYTSGINNHSSSANNSFNSSVSSHLSSNITSNAASRKPDTSWREVGTGEMAFMWIDIYRATLLTATGQYLNQQLPVALEIEYYRDIDADDLVSATIDQWQHLGLSQQHIDTYSTRLNEAWPDVKEGDRISFKVDAQGYGVFWYNDHVFYQARDVDFSQAFLSIWLSEQTSEPELRAQLIGLN
ncbi:chalcone isomerase family protein [Shewanella intestini]|uniref:Chalcone isomerase domain-containing protein n=1 Tax=Shewanella intestini TaxID=2017544 RepID=A0ABS5HY10_9GAMM|nr:MULTISPECIES: chalcone isomerase family protein [Shewanella]MBR9726586.1 hypothetical protein [Shewanella intestini]